ncbi:MAG: peptidylprolyl isomerase [bacterium]|nr:peptidylprolyl isomerase [bacterium]
MTNKKLTFCLCGFLILCCLKVAAKDILPTKVVPTKVVPTKVVPPDKVVISINETNVTYAQYKMAFDYHLNLYKEKYGKFSKEWEGQLKNVVIEGLILEALLLQEAKKTIKISDEEIQQRIKSSPEFKDAKGKFNEEKYRMALANPNINWERVSERQRNYLLREKMEKKIKNEIKIPEQEIRKEFCKDNEKIRLKYVYIKSEEDKVIPGTITETEIEDYYTKHSQEYQEPEQVRARHILIKEDRLVLEDILKQIHAGGNFEELAKKYSTCPSNARGGDLGFFGRGQMVKPFEDAAFSLKPGEISGIVETQFGFHIIKLEERREARTRPIDEAKEEIENTINFQKVKEEAQKIAQSKTDEIYSKIATDLEAVANEYQLEVKDSGLIGHHQPIAEIGYFPEFENMFDLKQAEISKPIKIWTGFLIAQLIERQIDEAKYNKEKGTIKQNIFNRKSQTALEDWCKKEKQKAKIKINL